MVSSINLAPPRIIWDESLTEGVSPWADLGAYLVCVCVVGGGEGGCCLKLRGVASIGGTIP